MIRKFLPQFLIPPPVEYVELWSGIKILSGKGEPDGVVSAPNGSLWIRSDAPDPTHKIIYVKYPGIDRKHGWT